MFYTKNDILYRFRNGNYIVTIYKDGTKERVSLDDTFQPAFPEAIDLKITDRCDLGCAYCHEMSTPYGRNANYKKILVNLKGLPKGTEIAIGGGNIFEHPFLTELLIALCDYGLIVNITINAHHIKEHEDFLSYLEESHIIRGIGISYDGEHFYNGFNVVYHMIVGIHTFEEIMEAIYNNHKILLLGYKKYGRGKTYYNKEIEKEIAYTKENLWQLLGTSIISFDNLALKQLEVNKHFTRKGWDEVFMGKDGKFTMYYDAVENYYAVSSTSNEKANADIPVVKYFKNIN